MEDPSGAWEWTFTILVSLFSLFLLLCIVGLVWEYVLGPGWKLVTRRSRASAVRQSVPGSTLLAALGGHERLEESIAARIHEAAPTTLGRRASGREAAKWARKWAAPLLQEWSEADGRISRTRRALLGSERDDAGRTGFMAPREFVAWSVDRRLEAAAHTTAGSAGLIRGELLAAVGGLQALKVELRGPIAERARTALHGRRPGEGEVTKWVEQLASSIQDRWIAAGGRAPRARRDFPPQTWAIGGTAEEFVAAWNERTYLHEDAGRGRITLDDLLADGLMTEREYVDWRLDAWVKELEQETALGCADVVFMPLFGVGIFTALLTDGLDLAWWVALPLAVAATALLMWPYVLLRRRGYIAMGDD